MRSARRTARPSSSETSFYNTPARKKFLKTAQTEGNYISDLMERLALSHPDVSFKFISNGQTKMHTSGNSNEKRSDLSYLRARYYGGASSGLRRDRIFLGKGLCRKTDDFPRKPQLRKLFYQWTLHQKRTALQSGGRGVQRAL